MPKRGMTDEELQALVDGEFDAAMGGPGGEISADRAQAWDYYLQKPFGNEVEGESQVVTSDVADAVDGMLPSQLRIFTTAENLVSFDPVGPEDQAAAEQESDYINHVFFKQNNAFILLYTWFLDALLQKVGYVQAWWDERRKVTRESYRGLTDEELEALLADEELEPIEREERTAETVQTVMTMLGPMQIPVTATVHDVVFKRTTVRGRARVENVPPEEMRISADARELGLDNARFVGRERDVTRSELLEMGFDKDQVAELPSVAAQMEDSEEDNARRDKSDEDSEGSPDFWMETVRTRMAFVRADRDGDGRAELLQVFIGGGELLEAEEVDRQIFHALSPHPLPHKHHGLSVADKTMDIQQVNSTLWRQILQNLYHTNKPGHAVWEQAMGENTLDDLLTTRTGRIARFSRPVGEAWAPMTVPFTAGATFPMLDVLERAKRNRTGVNPEGLGLEAEALKNIQSSVLAQANDLGRMKVEAVARIFAETGIKGLFLHLHEIVMKHERKPQVVRLRNEWVTVDPLEWRERNDMTVNIGLGIGTREQNLLHLTAIWEKQAQIFQGGGAGILISPRNLYNTAAEVVKNANLKNPELYFMDPGDKPFPAPRDAEGELARLQADIAARQQQLDAARIEMDRLKAEAKSNTETVRLVMQDRRDRERLALDRQKEENAVALRLEEIATKLTELELKFATNVPGSRV